MKFFPFQKCIASLVKVFLANNKIPNDSSASSRISFNENLKKKPSNNCHIRRKRKRYCPSNCYACIFWWEFEDAPGRELRGDWSKKENVNGPAVVSRLGECSIRKMYEPDTSHRRKCGKIYSLYHPHLIPHVQCDGVYMLIQMSRVIEHVYSCSMEAASVEPIGGFGCEEWICEKIG